MSERAALPDLDTLNHEALKALIIAQHAQILFKNEQLLSKEEQLASRDEEIERLKLLIAKLRPKLACACCDKIVKAEAASRPIERGMAGPGLLAHVLVSKYCDHLPLYRQSEIYARDGVELDRSTLAEWVGGCSRLLEPLVEALRRHVMSAEKLHADDTPVPVLAPGNGKPKTGRVWPYVRDDRPWGDQTTPD